MLLLVMFSIFLDIVQNARDWNEKLSRAFKYMNQWFVQVFVCLVGCVFFFRDYTISSATFSNPFRPSIYF